jgi:hypothetical protein
MLLDYILNKQLTKVGDILYKEVINHISKSTDIKITAKRMTDVKRCCYCIILNTAYMVSKGKPYITLTLSEESYSNPAVYNGNNTGRKVSFTNMKIVLSYLENFTNSIIEKGGAEDYVLKFSHVDEEGKDRFRMVPKSFKSSRLYVDERIVSQVVGASGKYKPVDSVLEVRDENGKPIGIRLTAKEKHLVDVLNAFNASLDKSSVSVQDNKFYFTVKKIYNNSSLREGGRIFMSGSNVSELLNKQNRREIYINGIATVELDYSQLWPRIAADLIGQTLSPDFDVYAVEIEGYCPKVLRDLAKIGLMCLLNADSFESAYYATLGELKSSGMQAKIDDALARGMWREFPVIRKMLDMLMDRNAYLMDYFFTKKATFLMNIESSLMDYLLERAVEDDRILIPIHDSVVVQEDYAQSAEVNMYRAYEVIVGGNNCVVRTKGVLL